MKLLLVEDNPQSADLVKRLFQGLGYEVTHTIYGLEGLRLARQKNFDVILLDFNLPDLDGSAIGLVLSPILKTTPIIALTAQDDPITRSKAKRFGFSAFVAKPWDVVELVSTVQKFAEQGKARGVHQR